MPLKFISSRRALAFAVFLGLMYHLHLPASPTFSNAVSAGTVSISALTECSGMVASRNNANVLWTHNDSGDSARVFALDTQGRLLGTYTLGVTHTDYEDIGYGPGPVTNLMYLFVGDIGDNGESRSNIRVYQIPEPAVYARQYTNPATAAVKGLRTITLTYPDGAHNAEGLFVDPWTGDLFITTKQSSVCRIYTAPRSQLDTNNSFALTFVRQINFDIVSAADISPRGNEIIFRQEDFARLWTRAPGQTISNALAASPVIIPVVGTPTEPNGEAVCFDSIGGGYFTLSETSGTQPLNYFARSSNDGPRPPQTLLPAGAAWKYSDTGLDLGTTWRTPGYDDSGWSNGIAQLGYGNGDEKTVVGFGPNSNNKYITTYFRSSFTLSNAPCLETLTLKLLVDDGAVVFLNGTPVARFNLATNAAFDTFATAQSTNHEDTWFGFQIDPHLLVNGTNTLAVEIHQSAANSSDISFDLQLVAEQSLDSRFTSLAMTDNRSLQLCICGPSSSNLTVQASQNLTNWSTIGAVTATNGTAIFLDSALTNGVQKFFRVVR